MRCREYSKHGKSIYYKSLVIQFNDLLKSEVEKYRQKIIDKMKNGQIGSIYPFLRKIANGPNDTKNKPFNIPEHLENNFSPLQCAENIAEHFSGISQNYEPIDIRNLPSNLQTFILSPRQECLPFLSDYEVHHKIKNSKKSDSCIKGEVHPKIIRTFQVEFAKPVAIIFNQIIKSQKYPEQWKEEHGVPIPKSSPVESIDNVRIISKTNSVSKIFESFIVDWLFPVISPHLDSCYSDEKR